MWTQDFSNLPNPSSHTMVEVYSASNRNEHRKYSWEGYAQTVYKAENLTTICESTV
jgi:hypothetical protein